MSSYMIRFSYDGTFFHGYQKQDNGRTVSEEVLSALKKTFGSVYDLAGCSRTDSGVHALDYCASFKTQTDIAPDTVIRAVNSWLPSDIVVFYCVYVDCGFHARYNVKEKEYMYIINNSAVRNPFTEKYALHQTQYIDIDTLNIAANAIKGTHDFSSFMASGSTVTDCVRTVFRSYFIRESDTIRFYIAADGFLYKMVRIIVGTLLDMSCGKISYDAIPSIIESKNRFMAGSTAAAHALFLNKVTY